MKIIEVLEDHWVDADLPDWTAEQMKQTVLKVYQQSLVNEKKPIEISGASIRRGRTQPVRQPTPTISNQSHQKEHS